MKLTNSSRLAAALLILLLCVPVRADAARFPCSSGSPYPSCPTVRVISWPRGCVFPGADSGIPSVPVDSSDRPSVHSVPNGSPDRPVVPTVPAVPDDFSDRPAVPDNAPDEQEKAAAPEADSSIASYEAEVIRLVNEVRTRNGLNTLTADGSLCRFARLKSQDMRDNRYFSHDSPTYGTPFQMMKSLGVTYRTAGENIAYGYTSPQSVMDGWMNSEGHRANILNPSYTRIGVGYVADGHYWTQWFTG